MNKGEQKRQFIIEKAALLFNEKGIAGTSVDDVLEVANTSKGCFYGHFESKDELAQASVDFLLGKLTDRRNNTINKHKTAITKIYAVLDNSKNPLKSYIDGGCPIVNFSTETDDTNPAIKKKIKDMVSAGIAAITNIIKDGIASGELSNAINADEFATRMMLSIEGGNVLCRVLNSTKPMQVMIKNLKEELASYALEKA
ncbi:DNA-binding transcriptional regulator, AcrR family [Mucilaginibacter gossypiicola]|uniref:DNA-binding transcriptional regulator, AcrR family n=1 Tax=Mucilaginibacter gossypiicola TaxID=551995 RepID=A0A1H8AME9_9SPHI|nr:TetR/AcrR family transcriptional regulator [Mucilaginibacter gossypiicola]SEM71900.1 DNA-binding transcriptional regulator, AcrR family [Mucilaginibacter gossypiicola]